MNFGTIVLQENKLTHRLTLSDFWQGVWRHSFKMAVMTTFKY